MIRINLLPIKTSRRQEAVKQELFVALAAAGAVLVLLISLQVMLSARVNEVEAQNTLLQQEIKQVENIVKEVEQLEEMKAELEKKLSVIKQLKASKGGPVHMLDQLSQATPEKLQLVSLDEKNGRIEMTGIAVSNEVVSQFLVNLERSEYFTDVFLNEIDQSEKDGVKLKDFSITARLVVPGSTPAISDVPPADSEG